MTHDLPLRIEKHDPAVRISSVIKFLTLLLLPSLLQLLLWQCLWHNSGSCFINYLLLLLLRLLVLLLLLLLRTLDGDAHHSNESCCPPQSLRVTKERVPQRGVHWPCFSPDNIMVWTVLEQVLASHWGCVTRTAIRNCFVKWELAGQEPVAKQILRRKWGWIRHTLRKPASSTTRQALTWNPQGEEKERPASQQLEARH